MCKLFRGMREQSTFIQKVPSRLSETGSQTCFKKGILDKIEKNWAKI